MPLGAALGAWLAGWLGLADTAVLAAVAAPLSALPVVFSAVRGVRTMPDAEPDPVPSHPASLDLGAVPLAGEVTA
jgi:hypothetical protein